MIERCDSCKEKLKREIEEMTKEERDDYINSIADGLKEFVDGVDEACDLLEKEKYLSVAIRLGELKQSGLKYFMELNL